MRTVILSAIKAGITRLRIKGGANPESLYDGVNGYVTAARTIKPRPGSSVSVYLPQGTIGLSLFDGVFQVFSSVAVDGMPSGYNLNVLGHEDPGGGHTLVRIWKAEPFMGALYVVAEWSDGSVYHYYLQKSVVWAPDTIYKLGDLVHPTTPNGLAYRVTRLGDANPKWAPSVLRTVGDVIEPTVDNGFKYTAIETIGDTPKSGTKEPAWPANNGATTYEDSDLPQPPLPPNTGGTPPGGGYTNPGGGAPPKGGGKPTDPNYNTVIQ